MERGKKETGDVELGEGRHSSDSSHGRPASESECFVPETVIDRPELPSPRNLFAGIIQFFVKGESIPYKVIAATLVWTAFIVSMSYLESRRFKNATGVKCLWWCSRVSIDSSATTYTGFPLFLLLSFRVNEAFSRYTEAAFIWEVELEQSVLQFVNYVGLAFKKGLFHENDRERIFGITASFVETLKRTLRNERDLGDVAHMLSKRDAASILAADDMPEHCISLLNAYLMAAAAKPASDVPVPGPWFTMVMGIIQNMAKCKARCVRIQNYKVVYGYAAHLRVFIGIWLAILPLALVQNSGWVTILWAPLIAYGVAGMEEVAVELSDPFGYQYNDLRLGRITRRIQNRIRDTYFRISEPMDISKSTPAVGRVHISDGGVLTKA